MLLGNLSVVVEMPVSCTKEEALMVTFPPSPRPNVLAATCEPSAKSNIGVLMVTSPPLPVEPLSAREYMALSKRLLGEEPITCTTEEALTVTSPPSPGPKVLAATCAPLDRNNTGVLIVMSPPVPV